MDDCIEVGEGPDGTWSADTFIAPEEFVEDGLQADLFPPSEEEKKEIRQHYVYKRNELVHGKFALSAFSLKTLSVLISRIDPQADSLDMPTFKFSIPEFARMMKVSRQRVYEVIENVTDELQQQVARLPKREYEYEKAVEEEKRLAAEEDRKPKKIPRPKPDSRSFRKVNWFDHSELDASTGTIHFTFHRDMAPYIRGFSGYFTKYSPDMILDMRSQYSIRLYEILRSFLSLKSAEQGRGDSHRLLDYKDLRDMLGIDENKYPRFSSFETRVLKQAQKELKDSDLDFSYSFPERATPKSKTRITKILFHIKARNMLLLAHDAADATILIPDVTLKKLIAKYGEEQVVRNLAYVKEEIDRGFEPENPRAFAIYCIRQDSANTEGALNPYSYTNKVQRDFVSQKLSKMWEGLPQSTREEFIKHRFCEGVVADLFFPFPLP